MNCLLESFLNNSAQELIFATNQWPVIVDDGARKVIGEQPSSTQELTNMLSEMVPLDLLPDLIRQGRLSFEMNAFTKGKLHFDIEKKQQNIVIRVKKPTRSKGANLLTVLERSLVEMTKRGASDLYLSAGRMPMLRIDGSLTAFGEKPTGSDELERELSQITPKKNRQELTDCGDTDFSHEMPEFGRFRINLYKDVNGIGAVLRRIPLNIPTPEDLQLPQAVREACLVERGLILVTGLSGSGRTTTIAAMVDFMNRKRDSHIVTIEDPVEFLHFDKRCRITQREIGTHTTSFKKALHAVSREAADIVVLGEIQDFETLLMAMELAERGCLVVGAFHTATAVSTVDWIVNRIPAKREREVKCLVSESLVMILAQALIKKTEGGRTAAFEVLTNTPAIATLIQEGKTALIPSLSIDSRKSGSD